MRLMYHMVRQRMLVLDRPLSRQGTLLPIKEQGKGNWFKI